MDTCMSNRPPLSQRRLWSPMPAPQWQLYMILMHMFPTWLNMYSLSHLSDAAYTLARVDHICPMPVSFAFDIRVRFIIKV